MLSPTFESAPRYSGSFAKPAREFNKIFQPIEKLELQSCARIRNIFNLCIAEKEQNKFFKNIIVIQNQMGFKNLKIE